MPNVPVPGTLGSLVNAVNPGTNVRGAHVLPPSVEYENPHPSLKSKSFHEPARRVPVGSIPSVSSLSANWSAVTLTAPDTEVAEAARFARVATALIEPDPTTATARIAATTR